MTIADFEYMIRTYNGALSNLVTLDELQQLLKEMKEKESKFKQLMAKV